MSAGGLISEEVPIMKSRMTGARILILSLAAGTVQFGMAMVILGGWKAFSSHPALIALAAATIGMMFVAPLSRVNLSSGEREDRGNRWVFIAFSLIALVGAIVPPYTDRIDLWTIDGETTRWIGLILYVLGGALRLWPVFVLGKRFSGLVAIQPDHTLETHGIYTLVRNPSYLGMVINMLGWGLAFRGWSGVAIALLLLVPLIPRIHSEERLLRSQFGAEYDAYVARTWRLIPGIY
jgi:protein-S-isoprenylcysteine O-methyltransferase Ste14